MMKSSTPTLHHVASPVHLSIALCFKLSLLVFHCVLVIEVLVVGRNGVCGDKEEENP